MKTFFGIFLTLILLGRAGAQNQNDQQTPDVPSSMPYAIVSNDAHSRIWQQTICSTNEMEQVVTNVHSYTELATGLNHLVNGEWVESKEEIDVLADGSGAAATNGQHQVYFPGDIYNGVIEMDTPDRKVLHSRPVGLSYFDGTNTVLIAELTNSIGYLVGANQVIYPDAFTGLKADLRYTYTKGALEQDVILEQSPLTPESFGLNPDTARLQVLTEFFDPPQPDIEPRMTSTVVGDLEDDTLNFGTMTMGQGKAFLMGTEDIKVPVNKQWLLMDGRQFLVEEVPVNSIVDELLQLPQPPTAAATTSRRHSPLQVVSTKRLLPAQHLARTISNKPMQITRASAPSKGLVLDYVTMTSQTNYTFQGDTTYYISGTVILSRTNTFEGGTVLKYATNASISVGAMNWLGGPYRPVTLTAKDDNSVGEAISGSSGNPTTNYYANPALSITTSGQTLSNFRIACAQQAISTLSTSINFYDGQFVNCSNGLSASSATELLRNVLFTKVITDFNNLSSATIDVQNGTFANSTNLASVGSGVTLNVTNSILANVTNLYSGSPTLNGGFNGFFQSPNFGANQITNTTNPFQVVGAGNFYLTNGCNYLNAGTTNLDGTLCTNLQRKTVWPPLVYTNVTLTNTTWVPQVARDISGSPNLGYHYDPIDYAVNNINISGTLTLTNGVAVAVVQGSLASGFYFGGSNNFSSFGTALNHNQICNYQAVQEQPYSWGGGLASSASSMCHIIINGYYNHSPTSRLTARFTDFDGLNGLGSNGGWAAACIIGEDESSGTNIMQLDMRDCRVGPGMVYCFVMDPANAYLNQCVNSVLERATFVFNEIYGSTGVAFYNNEVKNTTVDFYYGSTTWTVKDDLFDHSTISVAFGSTPANDYNAYLGSTEMSSHGAHDKLLSSFTYTNGALGNYYQYTNTLLNQGSTTANLRGLYHYVVQVGQSPEGTSQVSIGFHYVATDANGNLLDTDGDGVPDYIEDPNGNGVVETGETDWQNATDLGLKVIITKPRSGGTIP